MNCKKCNNIMMEGDLFCTHCGTSVNDERAVSKKQDFEEKKQIEVVRNLKIYLKNPISFFNFLKQGELKKNGLIVGGILAALSGIINILYVRSVIKKTMSIVATNIKSSSISSLVSIFSDTEAVVHNELLAKLDNTKIFTVGFAHLIFVMFITFVILEIINVIMIKEKLKHDEIIAISTISYIPLVLGLGISVLATKVSLIFGVFITMGSYILSFITLSLGLNEYCNEDKDKAFKYMTIIMAAFAIVLSFLLSDIFNNLIAYMSR